MEATDTDSEAVIGDECHIVAKEGSGPRGDSKFPEHELNSYSNLILLCKIHHKLVDDQPGAHTVDYLQKLKANHETWVRETLCYKQASPQSTNPPDRKDVLYRLISGKDVLNVLSHAQAYDFDHDELETQAEVDLVSEFLQNTQDWGEILADIESGERVRIAFSLTRELRTMEESGFIVFGGVSRRKIITNQGALDWAIASLRILRTNNPSIQKDDGSYP